MKQFMLHLFVPLPFALFDFVCLSILAAYSFRQADRSADQSHGNNLKRFISMLIGTPLTIHTSLAGGKRREEKEKSNCRIHSFFPFSH